MLSEAVGLEAVAHFDSLDCGVKLGDIYDKVTFNETSIYETPKGDLVAFMRTEDFNDHTAIARSKVTTSCAPTVALSTPAMPAQNAPASAPPTSTMGRRMGAGRVLNCVPIATQVPPRWDDLWPLYGRRVSRARAAKR